MKNTIILGLALIGVQAFGMQPNVPPSFPQVDIKFNNKTKKQYRIVNGEDEKINLQKEIIPSDGAVEITIDLNQAVRATLDSRRQILYILDAATQKKLLLISILFYKQTPTIGTLQIWLKGPTNTTIAQETFPIDLSHGPSKTSYTIYMTLKGLDLVNSEIDVSATQR